MTTLYHIRWRSGDPVNYRIVLETTPTFYFGKYIMNYLSDRCIKLERDRKITINAYGGTHNAWGHPDKWEYDYANIKKLGQWRTTDLRRLAQLIAKRINNDSPIRNEQA